MHSEAAWSELSLTPLMMYSRNVDDYIVYWGGVGMTRSHALSLASEIFLKIWASPQVKRKIWEDFQRMYYAGAFKTSRWDNNLRGMQAMAGDHYIAERYYGYIKQALLAKLTSQDSLDSIRLLPSSPSEVLSWFRKDHNTLTAD